MDVMVWMLVCEQDVGIQLTGQGDNKSVFDGTNMTTLLPSATFGYYTVLQDHILIPILSEDPSDDEKDDPVLVVHPNYVTE